MYLSFYLQYSEATVLPLDITATTFDMATSSALWQIMKNCFTGNFPNIYFASNSIQNVFQKQKKKSKIITPKKSTFYNIYLQKSVIEQPCIGMMIALA